MSFGEQIFKALTVEVKFRGERDIITKVRPCLIALPVSPDNKHRFAFVCEHLKSGYGVEDIINMFKNVDDFNERKTRYYIEHAKRKGYKRHLCPTLFKIGVCLGEECPKFRRLVKSSR